MASRSSFGLTLTALGLVSCGGIVIVDGPPSSSSGAEPPVDPWSAPPGVAAPLPGNGSSPDLPSFSDPSGGEWSGWWLRFPTFGIYATSVATLDGDAIVAGGGNAGNADFGAGLLAPELLASDSISFLMRVSAAGKLLWVKRIDIGEPHVIVDGTSHIRVLTEHGFQTYDGDGQLSNERTFGEHVTVGSIAPTADGGLLVGLGVDSGDVDLGSGPVPLVGATPLGLLVRLNAQGQAINWHEASTAVNQVGEDGAGNVLAGTSGSQPVWDGVPVGPVDGVIHWTCFYAGGSPLWGSTMSGFEELGREVAVREGSGMLLSGGAHSPLSFDGKDVPYGASGTLEERGVVLRVGGTGQLESTLVLGKQAYFVAPGPGHMLAAATNQVAPVGMVWCANGVEPCDRYSLSDTEASGNYVTVSLKPTVAYVAGTMRLTPGGSQSAVPQLYLMKIVH